MNPNELVDRYPFLTKEYLEGILQKEKHDENILVQNFRVNWAIGKGENFSSDILRLNVDYTITNGQIRNQKYILKVALVTKGMAEMLEEYDVFHREIVFYDHILPRMNHLLKVMECKQKLAPSCHIINYENPKHFVFEDLVLDGFRPADRKRGLNFLQLELALEKVAQFHAIIAFLYSEDKTIMNHHHYRNISEDVQHFYALFQNSMVVCAEMAETWPTTSATVARKLYNLERTVIAKGCQVYTWDEINFNVLNHGDLWVNNVMYKYDSQDNPTEAMLVDFAISYFGSPAIDLSFLLFTSSSDDVTTEQFDLLLQCYHKQLTKCLQRLGYSQKLPTLLDIQVEMLRKGFIGVMYSVFLIPLRLIEDTANADLGNLLGSTDEAIQFRRTLFKHTQYQTRMEYLLSYYDRTGFLD